MKAEISIFTSDVNCSETAKIRTIDKTHTSECGCGKLIDNQLREYCRCFYIIHRWCRSAHVRPQICVITRHHDDPHQMSEEATSAERKSIKTQTTPHTRIEWDVFWPCGWHLYCTIRIHIASLFCTMFMQTQLERNGKCNCSYAIHLRIEAHYTSPAMHNNSISTKQIS